MRVDIKEILVLIPLVGSAFVMIVQLLAIPFEWVADVPENLKCMGYVMYRRGWGCSLFGTIVDRPLIAIAALLVAWLCLAWLTRYRWRCFTITQTVLCYLWVISGPVGVVGSVLFLLGDTKTPYGLLAVSSLCIFAVGYRVVRRE